ncbi:hypothetical protein B0I35DRAFT_480214 [Stachybotrys elegans]|uniref:Uncharacterized protein n=1 Tax=Stachybotrys elegans TaxID=80388 RepID=A0A8K0SND9_9HYPO|nr:hypothetical protein B0I35DRAFT_480214 [Stachybotrys elegans]
MTATDLPPINFDDGFRIVLLPTVDESPNSPASDDSSIRYSHDLDDASSINGLEPESAIEPASQPGIPTHPVPSLQAAFAESLQEVTTGGAEEKPKLKEIPSQARRQKLLDQNREDTPFDAIWRYRPGQKQHEVIKLIAQITFGVYLLLNGMANDDGQVVGILQGHIDEVDEFLEVALDDMAQATLDMNERMKHLQVPLSNMDVLGEMLEDRHFRTEIIDRNEKIDHILARTNVAMKQWDDDIDAGLRCTTAFQGWLVSIKTGSWRSERSHLEDIYEAMKGNAEGWLHAFDEMNSRIQAVNELAIRLMTILAEMQKKTGEVNRQTWVSIGSHTFPLPVTGRDVVPDVVSPNSVSVLSPGASSIYSPLSVDANVTSPAFGLSRAPGSLRSVHSTKRSVLRSNVGSISGSTARNSIHNGSEATPVTGAQTGSRRGSISTVRAVEATALFDVEDLNEFPLPGATPLLPPTRNGTRKAKPGAEPVPRINTSERFLKVEEVEEPPEEPLYILQPRTYTPQPPPTPISPPHSPMMPMLRETIALSEQLDSQRQSVQPFKSESLPQKKRSLRQRISNPPEAIMIPPKFSEQPVQHIVPPAELARYEPEQYEEPVQHYYQNNVSTPTTGTSRAHDSVYGFDAQPQHVHQPSRMVSHSDFTSHPFNPLAGSPYSEHPQFYRPVQASPHSPLQQRPHTAVPGDSYRPSASYPQYIRHQPSRLGGMSMLSSVTTARYTERAATPSSRTQPGDKQLKKKKSAFGWFKKAFSLDEEEKAAFEARKAMRYQDPAPNPNSPKFLDGRRLR